MLIMLRFFPILFIFLCLSFFNSFSQNIKPSNSPESEIIQLPDTRVYYSVFVQSFYDANKDGIGDIRGLTKKLDYLKDLGIGGIWLLPVNPSPSYHKYDVTDYYNIHKNYGTISDFKKLVKEAHNRDIKILIDLVVNHTSSEHHWFRAARSGKDNEFRDYYIWEDDPKIWRDNENQWHQLPEKYRTSGKEERYFGFFWHEMPDLNFDNDHLRKEIIKIGNFWLKEIEVDGFRLDAIRHIYPDEKRNKNLAWWKDFGKAMKKTNPDVFLVGEVWGEDSIVAPFLANGISAAFNFDLADIITRTIVEGKDFGVINKLLATRNLYQSVNINYEDAIFLSNHDMTRILTKLENQYEKGKIAAGLLLTLPGNPFIYYGEEIGMIGDKPDQYIREPFLWDIEERDSGQTTWEASVVSNSNTVKPLVFQYGEKGTIFSHYKELIGVRNKLESLRKGYLSPYNTENDNIIAFHRILPEENVLVIINLSDEYQEIPSPPGIKDYEQVFPTNLVFKHNNNSIIVQEYNIFILKRTTESFR